jgi:hypothetical protein
MEMERIKILWIAFTGVLIIIFLTSIYLNGWSLSKNPGCCAGIFAMICLVGFIILSKLEKQKITKKKIEKDKSKLKK